MADDAHVELAAGTEAQTQPAPSDAQAPPQAPGAAGTVTGKADAQQAPQTVTTRSHRAAAPVLASTATAYWRPRDSRPPRSNNGWPKATARCGWTSTTRRSTT